MHYDIVQRLEASIGFDAINGDAHERNICKRQMAEAIAEINRLREVERLARSVMTGLINHGAAIIPHLMDTDDNDGQRLRVALGMPPLNWQDHDLAHPLNLDGVQHDAYPHIESEVRR